MKFDFEKQKKKINMIIVESLKKRIIAFVKRLHLL